jgi:peptidylprolyl isomerase
VINLLSNLPSSTHSRLAVGLSTLAASAILAAGCGSSGSSSTIGFTNQSSSTGSTTTSEATSTSETTAATGTTPTSGPLSKQPKVTPPSGPAPSKLVSKDLIKGTGPEAKAGDSVTVNYVGVLYHGGKEFDASWRRSEPFTFTLGEGKVIPGWDQGVVGMRVGGRRELIIPAKLAYGPQGQGEIPPNAPLVFVVDLLSV